MISVFTYFLGKLRGRNPSLEIGDVLTAEVYRTLPPLLASETERCQVEAIEIGAELKQLGAAPVAPDVVN